MFLLIVVVFYSLKKQLLTNRRLDEALKRVREQADQIEKIGALAEPSRLTAEIHDTVGHTLTSAVISIEAAEKLLEMGAGEVAPRLSLAKDLVKCGLEDIRMPETDGVEATRLIKENFPETTIIVLTTFDDDEYIINAMTCGASGYLLKDISREKLIEAIRDGVRGNIILPGRIASKIISRLVQSQVPKGEIKDFTEREKEIIKLLVLGKSNKEIAKILFLSVGTAKNYISQIYSKAEITDRANAVLFFKKLGL
ncbi:response regulator [Anaerosolibacter sp.]|uniref:response regulator n=1 Tax=Anaerosolibacter sp. TaxID=1872527 RepID=UPI0039EE7CAC